MMSSYTTMHTLEDKRLVFGSCFAIIQLDDSELFFGFSFVNHKMKAFTG